MNRNLKPPHKLALVAAITVGAAAFGLDGYAGTQTSNFPVTASVSANCTISTTAVAFGAYDPIVANATNPKDAAGTVVTTCTSGSSPTITLGQGAYAGAGSSATVPVRQMASGTDRLGYELYTDAARTTAWGNTGVAATAADGTAQTNTVYGRIPGELRRNAGLFIQQSGACRDLRNKIPGPGSRRVTNHDEDTDRGRLAHPPRRPFPTGEINRLCRNSGL